MSNQQNKLGKAFQILGVDETLRDLRECTLNPFEQGSVSGLTLQQRQMIINVAFLMLCEQVSAFDNGTHSPEQIRDYVCKKAIESLQAEGALPTAAERIILT
jgi:hypothetical protein